MANELLTRAEFNEAMKVVLERLDAIQGKSKRFITRQEILAEHTRAWYENMRKVIPPIKQGGRTSTAKYERKVYNNYVESLQ